MADSSSNIPIKEFYDAFTESLGVEGAQKLVKESIIESGLPIINNYPLPDALKICETLKNRPGMVKIIAGFLAQRFNSRNGHKAR